jgi:hypothetical protein
VFVSFGYGRNFSKQSKLWPDSGPKRNTRRRRRRRIKRKRSKRRKRRRRGRKVEGRGNWSVDTRVLSGVKRPVGEADHSLSFLYRG